MNVHQHLTLEDTVDDDLEDTVDDDETAAADDVQDLTADMEETAAADDMEETAADDVQDLTAAADDEEDLEEENAWRRPHDDGRLNGFGIQVRANWNSIQRAHWMLTVHFPHSFPVTRQEEDFVMRVLNAYLLENTLWKRLVIGYERCPSTRRFHAHVYLATERTVRMTRSLRSISLRVIPDLREPLRPHINYLDGPDNIINVIHYVVKKETKVRGGVLGKDTFIFAKDTFVESVLGGGPSPHPLASSLSTASATAPEDAPASPPRTPSPRRHPATTPEDSPASPPRTPSPRRHPATTPPSPFFHRQGIRLPHLPSPPRSPCRLFSPSRSSSRSSSRIPPRSPSRSSSRSSSCSSSRIPPCSSSRIPPHSPSRIPPRSPSRSSSHIPSRSPSRIPSRSPSRIPSPCRSGPYRIPPPRPQSPYLRRFGTARYSITRAIFEQYAEEIKAGKWGLLPEYFLFQNGSRCRQFRDLLVGNQPMRSTTHCRLILILGVPGSGKTSMARDFARTCYPTEDGLSFYMKPVSKWWDGYTGQPVVIFDDPNPEPFRFFAQELKIWGDRYPFIAEAKGRCMKICPEWFVITSNYSLEELTDGDAALYRALLRRADNGVRVFEFGENYYMPEEADIDDELHRFYRRRLEEFVDRVMNSHLPVCFDSIATLNLEMRNMPLTYLYLSLCITV